METRRKALTQAEWACHKAAILELYHDRKLPLQTKVDQPCVIQVMRDEHGFEATPAQYEAQIRRWDRSKNVKEHEWRQILATLQDLRQRQVAVRLKLYGQVVDEGRISRAQRRYLKESSRFAGNLPQIQDILDGHSSKFTLETLSSVGQWVPYNRVIAESNLNTPIPRPIPASSNDGLETTNISPDLGIDTGIDAKSVSFVHHVSMDITSSKSFDHDEISVDYPPLDSEAVSELPAASELQSLVNVGAELPDQTLDFALHPRDTSSLVDPLDSLPTFDPSELSDSCSAIAVFQNHQLASDTLIPSDSPSVEMITTHGNRRTFQPFHVSTPSTLPPFSPLQGFPSLDQWTLYPETVDLSDMPSGPLLDGTSSTEYIQNTFSQLHGNVIELESEGNEEVFSRARSQVIVSNNKISLSKPGVCTSLLRGVLQMIRLASVSGQNPQPLDVTSLLDSMKSLLPNDPWYHYRSTNNAGLEVADDDSNSPFHQVLLYSVLNNFAGIADSHVPKAWVMKQFFSHPEYIIRICNRPSSYPPCIIQRLVDNLFAAAVESCEEKLVAALLKINSDTLFKIDVNKCVRAEGPIYTPIGLAASLSSLNVVRMLLKAGADPNKTCQPQKSPMEDVRVYNEASKDALQHAIKASTQSGVVSDKMELVRELLDVRTRLQPQHFKTAIEVSYDTIQVHERVFEELLSRLNSSSHGRMFFEPFIAEGCSKNDEEPALLSSIARIRRNHVAVRLIKLIFHKCQALGISPWASHNEGVKALERTLFVATARDNTELAQFLLPFASNPISSKTLSAAIRRRNALTTTLVLERGVDIKSSPDRHPHLSSDEFEFSTPLAEAIAVKDWELVTRLEALGCLSGIHEVYDFECAIAAASATGSTNYLEKLLQRVPHLRGMHLQDALITSLKNDQTDAALILLESGAEVNLDRDSVQPYPIFSEEVEDSPLLLALQRHNKVVVEAILECDVNVADDTWFKSYVTIATEWGDIDIIGELLALQPCISPSSFKAAVIAGNEAALHLFLQHQHWEIGSESVTEAVRLQRYSLLEILLEHQAEVGGESVLEAWKLGEYSLAHRLLRHGADINQSLRLAVICGELDLIRFLLRENANQVEEEVMRCAMENNRAAFDLFLERFTEKFPKGKPGFGMKLLTFAIEQRDTCLLQSLLEAHMDPNSFFQDFVCGREVTCLGYALEYHKGKELHLVQLLIEYASGIDNIASLPPLWKHGPGPLETPLLLAIRTRNPQAVELMLASGADVNLPPLQGRKRSPLQLACELGSYKIVQILLSYGADVNADPAVRRGGTALQLAAISGSMAVVQLLLKSGAKLFGPKSKVSGRTPFEGAAEHGRFDILKLLWEAALPFGGIGIEEANSAALLARDKCQQGCVEEIIRLIPGVVVP